MSIRALVLAAAAVTSVALPAVADAQRYGGYGGYGQDDYYDRGDRGDYYRDDRFRDDRARERWDRHRWQERRRFEEAQRRRWAWEHRHDRYDDRYRGYPY